MRTNNENDEVIFIDIKLNAKTVNNFKVNIGYWSPIEENTQLKDTDLSIRMSIPAEAYKSTNVKKTECKKENFRRVRRNETAPLF